MLFRSGVHAEAAAHALARAIRKPVAGEVRMSVGQPRRWAAGLEHRNLVLCSLSLYGGGRGQHGEADGNDRGKLLSSHSHARSLR